MAYNYPVNEPRFNIILEVGCVLNFMSAIRELNDTSQLYPDLSSKFLTSYPSFLGNDWNFDDKTFTQILDKSVNQHNLFSSTNPFRYAQRDIKSLRTQGASISIFIPPYLSEYFPKISNRIGELFPSYNGKKDVTVFSKTDLARLNTNANIWVARSPELVEILIDNEQPFILMDGKENIHISDVVRLSGWDLIGNALQNACEIHSRANSGSKHTLALGKIQEEISPHCKIWNGYQFVPNDPLIERSLLSSKLKGKLSLTSNPEYFEYSDGEPFSKHEIELSNQAIVADILELQRKQELLRHLIDYRYLLAEEMPEWLRVIKKQDIQRSARVKYSEKSTRTNPLTGEIKADPLSNLELDYTAGWTGSNFIELIATHLNDFIKFKPTENNTDPQTIKGELAEFFAGIVLKDNGWDLLTTRPISTTKLPVSLRSFASTDSLNYGFIAKWTDANSKERFCELDIVAYNPDKTLCSIEVKTSSSKRPSAAQRQFMDHALNGGEIYLLNTQEIDPKKTLTILPRYMPIDHHTDIKDISFGEPIHKTRGKKIKNEKSVRDLSRNRSNRKPSNATTQKHTDRRHEPNAGKDQGQTRGR